MAAARPVIAWRMHLSCLAFRSHRLGRRSRFDGGKGPIITAPCKRLGKDSHEPHGLDSTPELVNRRAGRWSDGARLARNRAQRAVSRWLGPAPDAANHLDAHVPGGDARRHPAELPHVGALELRDLRRLAAVVGVGLLVSAGQRSAALDSLWAGRLAALGVCQAGLRARPGALPDVSRQLPPGVGPDGPAGHRDGAVAAGTQRARPRYGAVFLPVLFAMLLAAGARRRTWPW